MATWTKIPETHIASALGSAVGSTAGTIITAANKALDGVEVGIETAQRAVEEAKKDIQANIAEETSGPVLQKLQATVGPIIDTADTSLAAISKSLLTISGAVSTLETIAVSLKTPLPPLEVLIAVIKALPLPQRYLVVSFTVLESDLLEMLEQLIKQAEEEISGIEMIVKSLSSILKPIQNRIERIRAQLALLKVDVCTVTASASDLEILDKNGIVDKASGETLFSKIQDGLASGTSTLLYGLSEIDLSKPEIANQLQLAKEGDVVTVKRNLSGSFLETWFCKSDEQPVLPTGFPQETGSWFRYATDEQPVLLTDFPQETGSRFRHATDADGLWKVDLKVTGDQIIFGGLDSIPERATEGDIVQSLEIGKSSYLVLGYGNYDQKPGILKIEDWSKLLENVLDKIRNLPLSQDLKDNLTSVWNVNVVRAKNENLEAKVTKLQYISKLGETYTLEIIEDDHSPKVAVRRYVRVIDAGGVVVLDGIKTFSVDTESLIQEIKLQLDQLTQ